MQFINNFSESKKLGTHIELAIYHDQALIRDQKEKKPKYILMARNCHYDGCPCLSWVDSSYTELCGNCGHSFDNHW